jgi:hypothetical protein
MLFTVNLGTGCASLQRATETLIGALGAEEGRESDKGDVDVDEMDIGRMVLSDSMV